MKTMVIAERAVPSSSVRAADALAPDRRWFRGLTDTAVAVLYFLAAHVYDGVCYSVSNLYGYGDAVAIMSAVLFAVSAFLVVVHDLAASYLEWDILGLAGLNALRSADIPPRRVFKRLTRWTLQKGRWWIFALGSIFLGPPVVTPLLREGGCRRSAILLLAGGTLISVAFWVTVWSSVGLVTWNQYVLPLARAMWPS
jgi:hypothetical protein